ncbi:CaiB/BaiF CoA-transferase family protein [Maricurvus nonylphenolicus]|uniref:CaiB/BaiF CoA transferase family protein n=1 Tax=Maricurvus nonylphenolicus TaxID=1008307 RepID=UPI0036F34BAA
MGPLSGFKIIEIKGIGPGPYAGMILADLGAEVIVVERASKPNSIAPPSALDIHSRGKKSIALNLKSAEGLATLLKLVKGADAIFEGFRPGVAERLGFGPEACLEQNPALVYGRMTGWGQTGPLAQSAGHDLNYISLTGAAAAIGSKDRPVPPLNLVGDFASGSLFLVMGMLAALLEAQKSGKGQVVDAAISDGSAHLMSVFYTLSRLGFWSTERGNNVLDGGHPYYRAYETAEGNFVSVAPIEPHFFAELVTTLGISSHFIQQQNNPESWPEIESTLEEIFKTKTRDEWVDIFEGSDACVAGVLNYEEAIKHPHNQARKTYIDIDGIVQPAPAPRFSRSICDTPDAPHAEGNDTESVLTQLGLSDADIQNLHKVGAIT